MKPAREFVAEFLGTFALTFIGGAAIMQTRNVDAGAGLVEVALAHGLVYAAMVSALMKISGNFNPAVSIGLLVTGRISPTQAATFIGGQVTGAILAALSLKSLWVTEPGEMVFADALVSSSVFHARFGDPADANPVRTGTIARQALSQTRTLPAR